MELDTSPQPSPSLVTQESWQRLYFKFNPKLLPLKLAIFAFHSSVFSILPYLTVHMKDIGITISDIAIIYTILPFTVFVSLPFIGYLADKLGNYTRVIYFVVIGCGLVHTALLAVPGVMQREILNPIKIDFSIKNNLLLFVWKLNKTTSDCSAIPVEDQNQTQIISFSDCFYECLDKPKDNLFGTFCQKMNLNNSCSYDKDSFSLHKMTYRTEQKKKLNSNNLSINFTAFSSAQYGNENVFVENGCIVRCETVPKLPFIKCFNIDGNRYLLNALYFVIRVLATILLASSFILIDAQLIKISQNEKIAGRHGALGRHYTFAAIAQAIISPLIGILMDAVGKTSENNPNYLVPFISCNIFSIICVVSIKYIKVDLDLNQKISVSRVVKIFLNLEVALFVFFYLLIGICFGFIETFLFVFLKDEMNASMSLLGLTITVGALTSIPFLFFSVKIVNLIGNINTHIIALFAYSVRSFGYSYITSPWMAFPFEALEIFSLHLMRIAACQFVGNHAPKGLLATMTAICGGIHYGFGRGFGALIGGSMISLTGNIAFVFRMYGIAAGIAGFTYMICKYCFMPSKDRQVSSKIKSHNEPNLSHELLAKTTAKIHDENSPKVTNEQ